MNERILNSSGPGWVAKTLRSNCKGVSAAQAVSLRRLGSLHYLGFVDSGTEEE